MIRRLRGRIEHIEEDHIIVDVGAFGIAVYEPQDQLVQQTCRANRGVVHVFALERTRNHAVRICTPSMTCNSSKCFWE